VQYLCKSFIMVIPIILDMTVKSSYHAESLAAVCF